MNGWISINNEFTGKKIDIRTSEVEAIEDVVSEGFSYARIYMRSGHIFDVNGSREDCLSMISKHVNSEDESHDQR